MCYVLFWLISFTLSVNRFIGKHVRNGHNNIVIEAFR
jgi:hypothetical protein